MCREGASQETRVEFCLVTLGGTLLLPTLTAASRILQDCLAPAVHDSLTSDSGERERQLRRERETREKRNHTPRTQSSLQREAKQFANQFKAATAKARHDVREGEREKEAEEATRKVTESGERRRRGGNN